MKANLGDLFSSKGRIRVLKVLALETELLISQICRKTGLNHTTVKNHLDALVEARLIIHTTMGRIQLYRFDRDDIRARGFRNFLDLYEGR